MFSQRLEPIRPKALVRGDPRIHAFERPGAKPISLPAANAASDHKSCIAQDGKMLRNRSACNGEALREIVDRLLAASQPVE